MQKLSLTPLRKGMPAKISFKDVVAAPDSVRDPGRALDIRVLDPLLAWRFQRPRMLI